MSTPNGYRTGPPALPAPIPIVSGPSSSSFLVDDTSPSTHVPPAGAATTLHFRSSPSPPLPLSLSLSPRPGRSGSISGSGISPSRDPLEPEERYRATMERYTAFESAMAALRRSVSPALPPLSPPSDGNIGMGMGPMQQRRGRQPHATASPPRLPPLELSVGEDEQEQEEGTMYPRVDGMFAFSFCFHPFGFFCFDVDVDFLLVRFSRVQPPGR